MQKKSPSIKPIYPPDRRLPGTWWMPCLVISAVPRDSVGWYLHPCAVDL